MHTQRIESRPMYSLISFFVETYPTPYCDIQDIIQYKWNGKYSNQINCIDIRIKETPIIRKYIILFRGAAIQSLTSPADPIQPYRIHNNTSSTKDSSLYTGNTSKYVLLLHIKSRAHRYTFFLCLKLSYYQLFATIISG